MFRSRLSTRPLLLVPLFFALPLGGAAIQPDPGSSRSVAISPRTDRSISAPVGFDVELLHEVDAPTQGSWVALCDRPDGTLYAVDQYGGLFRITPPPLDDFESAPEITPVDLTDLIQAIQKGCP